MCGVCLVGYEGGYDGTLALGLIECATTKANDQWFVLEEQRLVGMSFQLK